MSSSALLPRIKRSPPGVWVFLAWAVGTVYSVFGSGAYVYRMPFEPETNPLYPHGFGFDSGEAGRLVLCAVIAGAACWIGVRRGLTGLLLVLLSSLLVTLRVKHTIAVDAANYLGVDVAVAVVAATRTRRTAVVAVTMALITLLGYGGFRAAAGLLVGTSVMMVTALLVVVAAMAGAVLRQDRVHAGQLREQVAAQAVTAERLRIARELHDMVAHNIGVVAIQAGAAKLVIDVQPDSARKALGVIEDSSRETLAGLRRVLGALQTAEDSGDEKPLAGLDDVDKLVENIRTAGVRVDVNWRGDRRALPPEVDLSAFRIIQEAVTNVVKHSGVRQCRVSVTYRPEDVSVVIVDSGAGHGSGAGGGYGLTGMRDRVRLLKGDFEAGPRPEGGFRVAARLPNPEGVR
ncbi:sensor histidine kinase [Catenulispora subtropica]|uniref:histidine kinase n=1 Tax=Catenulispora subtropica TaxID=450798 RepID=A0ABP5BQW6_9ACTN